MSAEFSIQVDSARDLIRIKMGGFFAADDIARFLDARQKAHAQLSCGPNEHLTLNDIRDMKIQAQDIVDSFRDLLADPAHRSRRLAFVVSPTLAKMQLFRALDSREARTFEDPWAAEAWLYTGMEAAAA